MADSAQTLWWETDDPNLKGLSELLKTEVTPSWRTGIIPASLEALNLFFLSPNGPGLVEFQSPNMNDSLEQLALACESATFGRGDEDILDETYRKAGKLDIGKFAWGFQPDASEIRDVIESKLLLPDQADRGLKIELYKLNVYGKGSFFKAHKDTPRSEKMFASLVLILPALHEGGKLLLRHKGSEREFDAATLLREAKVPSIAYAVFYSDVEHEVTEVTSGHRVTITYNLHFGDKTVLPIHQRTQDLPRRIYGEDEPASPLPREVPLHSEPSPFEVRLAQLLDDPNFLPNGGLLGVGLQYSYPIVRSQYDVPAFDLLYNCLKGGDAFLAEAFSRLGLKHSLRIIYQKAYQSEGKPSYVLMATKLVRINGETESTRASIMRMDERSRLVFTRDNETKVTDKVFWILPPTSMTFEEVPYISYGNEANMNFLYADFSLIVRIGKVDDRASQEDI